MINTYACFIIVFAGVLMCFSIERFSKQIFQRLGLSETQISGLWHIHKTQCARIGINDQFFHQCFWVVVSLLIFYYFGPAVMFSELYCAKLPCMSNVLRVAGIFVGACCAMWPIVKKMGGDVTSFLAAIRCNAFLALQMLDGEQRTILALILAVESPLMTIITIVMLDENPTPGKIVKTILTNPTIIFTGLAIFVNLNELYKISFLQPLFVSLAALGKSAITLALISIGAGCFFTFRDFQAQSGKRSRQEGNRVFWLNIKVSLGKLEIFPALLTVLGFIFGLDLETLKILIILGATSCSVSAHNNILRYRGAQEADQYSMYMMSQMIMSLATLLILQFFLLPGVEWLYYVIY